jgi:hypothetical protein
MNRGTSEAVGSCPAVIPRPGSCRSDRDPFHNVLPRRNAFRTVSHDRVVSGIYLFGGISKKPTSDYPSPMQRQTWQSWSDDGLCERHRVTREACFMCRVVLVILTLISATAATTNASEQARFVDVYLIGGQSNATLRGYMANLPKEVVSDPRVSKGCGLIQDIYLIFYDHESIGRAEIISCTLCHEWRTPEVSNTVQPSIPAPNCLASSECACLHDGRGRRLTRSVRTREDSQTCPLHPLGK